MGHELMIMFRYSTDDFYSDFKLKNKVKNKVK